MDSSPDNSTNWLKYVPEQQQSPTPLNAVPELDLGFSDEHLGNPELVFTEPSPINIHDPAGDDTKRLLKDMYARLEVLEQKMSAKDAHLERLTSKVNTTLQKLDRATEDIKSGMQTFFRGLVQNFLLDDEGMLDSVE